MKQDDPLTVVSEFMLPTEKRIVEQTLYMDIFMGRSPLGDGLKERREGVRGIHVFLGRMLVGSWAVRVGVVVAVLVDGLVGLVVLMVLMELMKWVLWVLSAPLTALTSCLSTSLAEPTTPPEYTDLNQPP